MTSETIAILKRTTEMIVSLRHEMTLTQAAFAPMRATVSPVEVAPQAWLEARNKMEHEHGTRLRKFFG